MPPATRETFARGVAFAAVLLSTQWPWRWEYQSFELNNGTLALFGLVAVVTLRNGDPGNLRLMAAPVQGWWYWFRMACLFGLVIGVLAVIGGILMFTWGQPLPIPRISLRQLPVYLFFMCVYAPLIEEVIYRSLLAAAIEPALGFTGTIIASGVIFAAAHVINGNPGPDNQIAGFLLMWAFLRSGTILVPLAMHSAGNCVAVLVHVAAHFWHA